MILLPFTLLFWVQIYTSFLCFSLGKNRYWQKASGPAWPTLIPGLCLERLGFPWSIFGLCLLIVQNCRLLYQPTRQIWEIKKQSQKPWDLFPVSPTFSRHLSQTLTIICCSGTSLSEEDQEERNLNSTVTKIHLFKIYCGIAYVWKPFYEVLIQE